MRSNEKKSYEAPAVRTNGHFAEQTRSNTEGPRETVDVKYMLSAGGLGFGL